MIRESIEAIFVVMIRPLFLALNVVLFFVLTMKSFKGIIDRHDDGNSENKNEHCIGCKYENICKDDMKENAEKFDCYIEE